MSDTLTIMLRVAAVAVVALVPLINPAGTAPIFLSFTNGENDRARAKLAARIARNAAVLLTAATLGGSSILMFFGLSLAEIRIAGGLLVIATAWDLMHTDQRPDAAISALSRREPKDLTHAAFSAAMTPPSRKGSNSTYPFRYQKSCHGRQQHPDHAQERARRSSSIVRGTKGHD
jgi:small neutral amino acid transporter SnatA (MarC family)